MTNHGGAGGRGTHRPAAKLPLEEELIQKYYALHTAMQWLVEVGIEAHRTHVFRLDDTISLIPEPLPQQIVTLLLTTQVQKLRTVVEDGVVMLRRHIHELTDAHRAQLLTLTLSRIQELLCTVRE